MDRAFPPVLDSLDKYKILSERMNVLNYLSSPAELKFRVDQSATGISCTSLYILLGNIAWTAACAITSLPPLVVDILPLPHAAIPSLLQTFMEANHILLWSTSSAVGENKIVLFHKQYLKQN